MLSLEENERLTHTDPGTAMGATMRRYWIPAVLSWEIPEPDCPPVRVQLLGEQLIAFRDTRAGSDCSKSFAPTAAPRYGSGAMKTAACAVSTTAGNSTWRATAWTR